MKYICIGLMMGIAEVLPGVSGGTIAFISGIYGRLINALKKLNPKLITDCYRSGVRDTWESLDVFFLLSLFLGMGLGIILFANIIGLLLQDQPVMLWSFFFGLVLASSMLIIWDTNMRTFETYIYLGTGIALGHLVSQFAPLDIKPTPFALFFGGIVSVCAWILPGISGSFILLIFGLYSHVIEAIRSLELATLSALGIGCVLGVMIFSRILSSLLSKYRNAVLSVLVGLMFGSLSKLWPWKSTLSYHLGSDGTQIPLIQEPVFPSTYTILTNQEADVFYAILSASLGAAVVIILYRVNLRRAMPYV